MAKKGRTRKDGPRYASGRLKPEPVGTPPAAVRRIVAMAESRALDATLASQLGWLRLHKAIGDKQFAAGAHFATVVGQYERLMGLPRRTARAPSYERGYGKGAEASYCTCATDSGEAATAAADAGEAAALCPHCRRVAAVKRRYAAAVGVLRTGDPLG